MEQTIIVRQVQRQTAPIKLTAKRRGINDAQHKNTGSKKATKKLRSFNMPYTCFGNPKNCEPENGRQPNVHMLVSFERLETSVGHLSTLTRMSLFAEQLLNWVNF